MSSSLTPSQINALIVQHIGTVHLAASRLKVRKLVRDDLVSAGYEALVLASRRYDPEANTAFSTFAYRPVLGSMYDCLADQTQWSSRHAQVAAGHDAAWMPARATAPDSERRTLAAEVFSALEELPAFSRELIKGHFLEEDTLASVGGRMGLSKTRVSVHLARAMEELRGKLDDRFAALPMPSKAPKRRFSRQLRREVLRRVREPSANISQVARDLDVPRTTIMSWLKAGRKSGAPDDSKCPS